VVRWWHAHRAEVWLAVVVALVALPVLQPLMAQQASRYALTAAIVDDGTVRLDAHAHLLGVDRAERGGHVYSDKAPGQPVWGVPAYAAYRALGGSPAARSTQAVGDLGLWSVSAWSAALPAAALGVVMRRLGRRAVPGRPVAAGAGALSLALGTLLLPFATQLFSHVLAGLLGVAAWALAAGGTGRGRWLAAGALAGAAVTVEYPMILLAAVVVTGAAWRAARAGPGGSPAGRITRAVGWVAAGGLPFGLALAAYHWAVFGGPLALPYHFSQFAAHAQGVVGAQLPEAAALAGVLAGERGLLTLTPIVAVAVIGLAALLRRPGLARVDAVAGLVALVVLATLMAGWSGSDFGGASPGPRYVVPALPWLAAGAARAWAARWWPVTAAAAALATAAMLVATFTLPLAQPSQEFALGWWVQNALAGDWASTLLTRAVAPATAPGVTAALLAPLAAAAAAGVAWWRAERLGGW
jgi:hypothetical protein